MVKIAPKDIEQFIVNIPKNIRAVLLYGQDSGLVNVRAKEISKSRNIASKVKYEEVKNSSSSIIDMLNTIKLFGEDLSKEKIVIVECGGATLAEPLVSLVKNTNYKGMVLFCAGELGTDSSLRKAFESSINAAAVPCYLDDQIGVARIIQQFLKAKNITCEAGVVQLLSGSIILGNRELLINEIEKILLFLGDKRHILIADIEAYLQLQGEISFDKLCYQFSLRQVDMLEPLLQKLQNEGHNLVSISRMLMYHFNRLYQVRLQIDQGKQEQQVLSSLSPPLFFKQVNDFVRSLKLWDIEQLMQMLIQLNELELMSKQTASLANLMIKNMIIKLKA